MSAFVDNSVLVRQITRAIQRLALEFAQMLRAAAITRPSVSGGGRHATPTALPLPEAQPQKLPPGAAGCTRNTASASAAAVATQAGVSTSQALGERGVVSPSAHEMLVCAPARPSFLQQPEAGAGDRRVLTYLRTAELIHRDSADLTLADVVGEPPDAREAVAGPLRNTTSSAAPAQRPSDAADSAVSAPGEAEICSSSANVGELVPAPIETRSADNSLKQEARLPASTVTGFPATTAESRSRVAAEPGATAMERRLDGFSQPVRAATTGTVPFPTRPDAAATQADSDRQGHFLLFGEGTMLRRREQQRAGRRKGRAEPDHYADAVDQRDSHSALPEVAGHSEGAERDRR